MQGKQKVDLFHHMNAQNKAGPGWKNQHHHDMTRGWDIKILRLLGNVSCGAYIEKHPDFRSC